MPRLPTIRVIGSHDISLTRTFCCEGVSVAMPISSNSRFPGSDRCHSPALAVAGAQRSAASPPRRFDVVLGLDVPLAEVTDHRSVDVLGDAGGPATPLVLLHER